VPNWTEISSEIANEPTPANPNISVVDVVRRRHLASLSSHTGRNIIAYYSGWLNKPGIFATAIGDDDKNAFMNAVHKLDHTKGLDLILHTPGGDIAATESIVHYLHSIFNGDIRAIVPQIAMSAGTMIACSCKSIVMGKQSNLGPIDPQLNGVPAQAVIDEFKVAIKNITEDPSTIPLWQTIIGKYNPTFIGECERSIVWSKEIVKQWLVEGMFSQEDSPEIKADEVVTVLSDHSATRTHSRHIHVEDCEKIGLTVERLETDPTLQDLVLSVHHAYMHTFSMTAAVKLVENQEGNAFVLLGG